MCYHKLLNIFIIVLSLTCTLYAQKDTRSGEDEIKKTGINYFNYSDPDKINIEVIVLGGVKIPGKYLIPQGTTVIDILGLSGNILKEEIADNIKLIRNAQNNGKLTDNSIVTLKYRDLFKDQPLTSINTSNPVLLPGDILIIPIMPEKTFWDYFTEISVIVTPLVTIGTLIISIISLNK